MNENDSECFDSQDPEAEPITPLRTSSAQDERHPPSDENSPSNSDAAVKQLNALFDRLVETQPPSDVDVAFGPRVNREDSSATERISPHLRSQYCDVCLGENKTGNLVRPVEENYDAYSEIQLKVEDDEETCLPFRDAVQRAQEVFHDQVVQACGACRRDFKRLVKVSKSNKKDPNTLRRAIANRILRHRPSETGGFDETAPDTIQSNKCFLYDLTHRGPPSGFCSEPGTHLSRPLRLYASEDWIKEEWITEFAKKHFVSTDIAEQIVDKSYSKHVKLCSKHYTAMRHILDDIEEAQKACSICGGTSLNRSVGKTAKFPYDKLKGNADVMCIIEDALSSYVGRALRPKDIKYLCSPCKYIICHRVSFSELAPRCEETRKLRKGDFVYGPTPKAVRHCISFVDDELNNKKKLMVRLTDVQATYLRFIENGDDMVEKQLVLKDIRSLKKYILPSLASRGIYLEMGSRKSGYYFCTLDTIKNLVAESQNMKSKERASGKEADITLEQRRECLKILSKVFEERREGIENGEWELVEFIKATPRKLWLNEVCLFINRSLKGRCRANARLRKVSLHEEWPYNLDECPEDLSQLPGHEFSFITSTFFSLEREVYMLTQGRVRGPLFTAMSVTALTDVTTSFMSILNRLSCLTSYQTVDAMRRRAISRRENDGPFGEVVRSAFHSLAFDNINVRTASALDVHGFDAHGFDGFASQLVDANPGFNFEEFCARRPAEDCKPRKIKNLTRERFIEMTMPKEKDPDLELYRWMTLGLTVANKDAIATDDESKQRSLRNVLLNGVRGFSGGKAKVVYVTVSRESAQDELTIIRELRKIKQQLIDSTLKQRDKNDDTVIVAIVGDQPVFKLLFRLWYESYEKYLDGVKDSDGTFSLCEWMVPLPGGFHIDKQGMIPTVKNMLAGSGLEELAEFTGLSDKNQKNIIKLAHYRKNRRFLSQVMAAMILRISDVVCGFDDEFSTKMLELVSADKKRRGKIGKGMETEAERSQRLQKLNEMLPKESKLELSHDMTSECIELGKLLCEKIDDMSKHSANVKFLAKIGLLDLLIPWSGYNILARRGQTEIMDKFWFSLGGFLHCTAKLPYQENMLWYSLLKHAMPQVAYDVLFKEGHLVMTLTALAATCIHLDEAMEMCAIRHTKMLNTCIAEILERSPAFTMLVGRLRDSLERNINASRKRYSNAEVRARTNDRNYGNVRVDGEKKTAHNVLMMYELLEEAEWLGFAHRGAEKLRNVLRKTEDDNGDNSFNIFEVNNQKVANALLDANKRGRLIAALHVSAKLERVFGGLSEDEYEKHFGGKALSSKWTLGFLIKTMRDLDDTKKEATKGMKRKNPSIKSRRMRSTRGKQRFGTSRRLFGS